MPRRPRVVRRIVHPFHVRFAPKSADMCGARSHVCFGSKADMCSAKGHVRLPPKADLCSATRYVRLVPKADTRPGLLESDFLVPRAPDWRRQDDVPGPPQRSKAWPGLAEWPHSRRETGKSRRHARPLSVADPATRRFRRIQRQVPTPCDLNAVPDDRGGAFPEEKKPACLRTGSEHDFSGLVGCERKSGEALLKGDAIRVGNGHGTSTP